MLHLVADGVTEDVENDLADNEEENPEGYVTNWPAVL
jgi:hypothetical protein